jgi:hypothetical protein
MALIGWVLGTAVVLVLSTAWWIVVPFYLGSYSKGPKPVTNIERGVTLVAGVLLAAVWWYGVLRSAPFLPN